MIETRAVVLYWLDSEQAGEWTNIEEFEFPMKAIPACGIVVKEDDKSITLSISLDPDSYTAVASLRIPKSAIVGDVRTLCQIKMRPT